jgi:multicomponent Na+:H+ antiporter subunit C
MIIVMSLIIGVLFASASYLLLRRSMVKLLLGFILLGHGVNLLLFQIGGWASGPVGRQAGEIGGPEGSVTPLAQVFTYIAMLSSLGVVLLLLALIYRVNWEIGSDDLDDVTSADATGQKGE